MAGHRRIRILRKNAGMLQKALAKFLDLARANIANIEGGRQRISLHQIGLLAAALNKRPDELLPGYGNDLCKPEQLRITGRCPASRKSVTCVGAAGCRLRVNSDVLSARQPIPLLPQFQTYCCLAADDVQGQESCQERGALNIFEYFFKALVP